MIPIMDTIPAYKRSYVLYSVLAVNILVFVYSLNLGERELLRFFYTYGLVPARYTSPDFPLEFSRFNLLPFVTSAFMHGGWTHIFTNLWALFIFGDNVEDKLGHTRFLIYYLIWAVGANLVQFAFAHTLDKPIVGASGAVAGVMGAYLCFYPWSRVLTIVPVFFFPLLFYLPAYTYLIVWFLLQFLSGTLSIVESTQTGVAWWAHIGGFALGYIMARGYNRRHGRKRRGFYFEL
ncbi:MAG TPA: rhomboid family intramembrane serine protease [Kosmotogaceae bacterium]|nr:MAG: Rhomboid family protein [Thermotogales bacterium 46_20]HAA84897.1 rhomboid family intramembrane serine protease [Kosmotogaceae bacterium]